MGLAITQVLNLIGMCNWGLRQTAELENQMTSVERVLEYSKLKPEQDVTEPATENIPDSWPQQGGVVFQNVSLQYSPKAEPVLKDLSFEIKPKVGFMVTHLRLVADRKRSAIGFGCLFIQSNC